MSRHICTIIPPQIFQKVIEAPDISDEIKQCHRHTLHTTHRIRGTRIQRCQAAHAPAHGIIPPHVLSAIANSSTGPEHDAAVGTLEHDKHAREARAATVNRVIYDYEHDDNPNNLPGDKIIIKEGGQPYPTTKDPSNDGNECYASFGDTWKFYKEVFGRNSIDNKGMRLVGTVHFGEKYQNAFWDGRQMVFGDGDGVIFNDFTNRARIDVTAHELTHGITEKTANLEYQGQSGALNESMSDAFGIMVKQWTKGQTVENANWLIGEGIWTSKVKGRALRDMENPGTAYDDPNVGKDQQPAHMDQYQNLPNDEDNDMGGVHINSGIPNKAFYEAATRIGGSSWEGAGPIWYKTLTGGKLKSNATFQQFADLTYENAGEHKDKIAEAWKAVGITVAGGPHKEL